MRVRLVHVKHQYDFEILLPEHEMSQFGWLTMLTCPVHLTIHCYVRQILRIPWIACLTCCSLLVCSVLLHLKYLRHLGCKFFRLLNCQFYD